MACLIQFRHRANRGHDIFRNSCAIQSGVFRQHRAGGNVFFCIERSIGEREVVQVYVHLRDQFHCRTLWNIECIGLGNLQGVHVPALRGREVDGADLFVVPIVLEQIHKDRSGVRGGVCNGDAVCLCGAFQDKPFSTGASHVCSATSGFILDDCPADDVVIRIDNGGAFRLKARRGNAVISGDNGQVAVRLADERPVLLDLADHFLAIYQDGFQFAIVRWQKADKGLSTFRGPSASGADRPTIGRTFNRYVDRIRCNGLLFGKGSVYFKLIERGAVILAVYGICIHTDVTACSRELQVLDGRSAGGTVVNGGKRCVIVGYLDVVIRRISGFPIENNAGNVIDSAEINADPVFICGAVLLRIIRTGSPSCASGSIHRHRWGDLRIIIIGAACSSWFV